ncbi:hypothetical protein EV363DRAFT_1454272 [Boletus edulis]|nr:hypothetical protein EV363DRAFT_1454272 [Boletus edulis]
MVVASGCTLDIPQPLQHRACPWQVFCVLALLLDLKFRFDSSSTSKWVRICVRARFDWLRRPFRIVSLRFDAVTVAGAPPGPLSISTLRVCVVIALVLLVHGMLPDVVGVVWCGHFASQFVWLDLGSLCTHIASSSRPDAPLASVTSLVRVSSQLANLSPPRARRSGASSIGFLLRRVEEEARETSLPPSIDRGPSRLSFPSIDAFRHVSTHSPSPGCLPDLPVTRCARAIPRV